MEKQEISIEVLNKQSIEDGVLTSDVFQVYISYGNTKLWGSDIFTIKVEDVPLLIKCLQEKLNNRKK